MTSRWIENLVMRMESDFLEDSNLMLTLQSAADRFGVDEPTCKAVLTALVDSEVLALTREAAYIRYFPRLRGRAA
jgi:hypothetical protein